MEYRTSKFGLAAVGEGKDDLRRPLLIVDEIGVIVRSCGDGDDELRNFCVSKECNDDADDADDLDEPQRLLFPLLILLLERRVYPASPS
jgi:hypothetical protein